jgi:SPP1 family predicted phage head-tail adaptor
MADPFAPGPFDLGQMRHRLTLEEPGPVVPDGQGGSTPTWTTVGTYWARVRPLSGRELFNARQTKATTTHEITMRAQVPVGPNSRLLFESTGRIFNVDESLRVDETNTYRRILATEQAGETS